MNDTAPVEMTVPIVLTEPGYLSVEIMREDVRAVAQLAYALLVAGVPPRELLQRLSCYQDRTE